MKKILSILLIFVSISTFGQNNSYNFLKYHPIDGNGDYKNIGEPTLNEAIRWLDIFLQGNEPIGNRVLITSNSDSTYWWLDCRPENRIFDYSPELNTLSFRVSVQPCPNGYAGVYERGRVTILLDNIDLEFNQNPPETTWTKYSLDFNLCRNNETLTSNNYHLGYLIWNDSEYCRGKLPLNCNVLN